jgi:23S rRNA pseudouridine1911/1915/1917 synthase
VSPGTRLKLVVPTGLDGARLDRALDELVADVTRSQLMKLVRRGAVNLRGAPVMRSNVTVRAGDPLVVRLPETLAPQDEQPGADAVGWLYEDDDIAVVDKPAGLVCHPNQRFETGTLSDLAVERLGPLAITMGEERPGIVHRLDRETSGLMVLARNDTAMEALRSQFRERLVHKTYAAVVHGAPMRDDWEVDQALEAQPGHLDRQRPARRGRGRDAITVFRVLERLVGGGEAFAHVLCFPSTGRRHQIRVHLAEHGLPIAGDRLYGPAADGGDGLPHGAPAIGRHALHAQALEFEHPVRREPLSFEAPLPAELGALVDWLRAR